jgi:hypothetical protein
VTGTTLHIPTLETERLILRAPRREDFAAYEAFMLSPRSHVADATPRKVWHLFATEFFGWCLEGAGHWVIERRDGIVIGVTGISHPSYYPEPEMGWALYDGYEGAGLRDRGGQARPATGRAAPSLTGQLHACGSNTRSVAVAERLGAGSRPGRPHPTDVDAPRRVYRHWGAA